MMRKGILTAAAVLAAVSMAACGGSGTASTTAASSAASSESKPASSAEESEAVTSAEQTAAAETAAAADSAAGGTKEFNVGILQFMDHPSLNQIEENVGKELEALSKDGVKYNYKVQNGQGDATVLNQIAEQFISDKVDAIVPIATPAAQVVQSATEGTDLPVIFSAVSDPVSAKLVASMEKPGANITGTSDYLNTDAILDLMFAVNPDIDYVGLLYSKSEDSSTVPIEDAKKYLDEKGVKYIEKTGTSTDEVSAAVDALIAEQVDAVFTPTDNTIQSAELAFYEKLTDAKIPHYAGADSFALNGAFCGYGVDYANLGTATADMVDAILNGGQDPAETPVETFDNGIATLNTDTCQALGLDVETVKSAFAPYCTEVKEITTQKEFSN